MLLALEIVGLIDGILIALTLVAYAVWGPSEPSRRR